MKAIITWTILSFLHLTTPAQEYTLPAKNQVDQVKIAGNIHLVLIASDSMLLQFESDSVPETLDIEWTGNRLTLKTRSELKKAPAIRMTLYYASLTRLEIIRGARVQSADTLITDFLSLQLATGGKAEFNILTDSLTARVNQGADIILHGTTRSQLINAYTMGNYLGFELDADSTWIKAASGAQVKVNSSKYLNANATSKAFVGYLGTPEKVEFKTSVGGEITQQNP